MDEGQAEYDLLRLLEDRSEYFRPINSQRIVVGCFRARMQRDAVKPAVKGPWLDKNLAAWFSMNETPLPFYPVRAMISVGFPRATLAARNASLMAPMS